MNNTMNVARLKNSPKKKMVEKMDDSLHFTLSPNRKEKVVFRDSSRGISARRINKSS